jgi:hypothetical protein
MFGEWNRQPSDDFDAAILRCVCRFVMVKDILFLVTLTKRIIGNDLMMEAVQYLVGCTLRAIRRKAPHASRLVRGSFSRSKRKVGTNAIEPTIPHHSWKGRTVRSRRHTERESIGGESAIESIKELHRHQMLSCFIAVRK